MRVKRSVGFVLILDVRPCPTGGEGLGDSRTLRMSEGTYALICISYDDSGGNGSAHSLGEITVTGD